MGRRRTAAFALPLLVEKLQCEKSSVSLVLRYWLLRVYAANSLEEALRYRDMLPEDACIVVPAGHMADRYSIRLFASESGLDGVFARQQEIGRLEHAQQELDATLADAERQYRHAVTDIEEVRGRLEALQDEMVAFNERIHDGKLAILKREEAVRLYHEQSDRTETELSELLELMHDREASLLEEEKKLEELDAHLAQWQEREVVIHDKVAAEEENLGHLRETIRQAERKVQQCGFERESLVNRIAELERQIASAENQIQRIAGESGQGQLELQELDDGVARENLQKLLDTRIVPGNGAGRSQSASG